jgi:hypothetical protein
MGKWLQKAHPGTIVAATISVVVVVLILLFFIF